MNRRLPPVDHLTRPQYDGHACVWCAAPLWKNARSAGRAVGRLGAHILDIEVYACPACADDPAPQMTPACLCPPSGAGGSTPHRVPAKELG